MLKVVHKLSFYTLVDAIPAITILIVNRDIGSGCQRCFF
ncbi:hypothetical protein S7335_3044 [Synechococcus sp. PCC 7335]|nr:hypothetical protein S7335_3044 [Synechococcus sp. PCC 7335]